MSSQDGTPTVASAPEPLEVEVASGPKEFGNSCGSLAELPAPEVEVGGNRRRFVDPVSHLPRFAASASSIMSAANRSARSNARRNLERPSSVSPKIPSILRRQALE